jgi:hypothetical protein
MLIREMKRSLLQLGAVALVFLFAASCATVPVSQRDNRVEKLIAELNTADIDRVMELSARPFLFDGEIIILESDLRTMWTNLREAGFTFDAATVTELGPTSDTTYQSFADSMEVRVWFEKYAAEDAALATVDTSYGTFLIVTGDRLKRLPYIFGFTGPEEG